MLRRSDWPVAEEIANCRRHITKTLNISRGPSQNFPRLTRSQQSLGLHNSLLRDHLMTFKVYIHLSYVLISLNDPQSIFPLSVTPLKFRARLAPTQGREGGTEDWT